MKLLARMATVLMNDAGWADGGVTRRSVATNMAAADDPTSNRPNFLGIGMQKTGTTWLHRNLRKHEDVYLPPKKELRHLMEIAHGLVKGEKNEIELFQKQRDAYNRRLVRRNLRRLVCFDFRAQDLIWDLRYRLHSPTDPAWYAGQFRFSDARIRGEISPQYHRFTPEHIQAVKSFLPEMKVILLLRNPVDQIWSQAKMVLAKEKGRAVGAVPNAEFRAFFDHWRGINFDHLEIISHWSKGYGRENLLVGFFEDLRSDPCRVYRGVCEFLEIDPERGPTDAKALRDPVNPGIASAPQPEVERYLYDQWKSSIVDLAKEYPEAESWVR
jgi:hypothetical protein